MSKMKKRRSFFAIILTTCMFVSLFSVSNPVFAETSGEYTYSINSDQLTCTITKYNGAGGDVTIPSMLDIYTVTVIGKEAFRDNLNLDNIIMPNGVTTIGNMAFRGCKNLSSITIPNSVTTIQDYAFLSAENLNNVTIPNSVTFIGTQGFSNCYKLSNITIPSSVVTIGGAAFGGCKNLSSITIPNSITSIEDSTFAHCDNLKNVTIPNSVTSIKAFAFFNCNALESITIPQSVVSIGLAAFYDCAAFKSITIPQSVVSIGNDAFRMCPTLTSVFFDGKPSIGTQVFDGSPCTLYSATGESLSGIPCTTAATYSVTVNSSDNGSIKPSTLLGMKDQTISLQMLPDEGYTSNPTLLKYNDGGDVAISGNSFIMPDKEITITGGFEQIPIPTVSSSAATTNNQKPTWSWTSATGEEYYRYKLDGGSWNYTNLTSFTPVTDLTYGMHTLYVQEINNNADWSCSGSTAVTVITPTYNVGIESSTTGGTITASPTTAKTGDTVNLTITPSTGKQLKAGTLRYNDGSDHAITGTSFTMPATNVTVTAEFEDIPVVIPPKSSSGSSHHNTKTSTMPSTSVSNQFSVPSFSDITTHWAKEDIEFVVSQGLMNGTSDLTFAPQVPMTRGMFVTALGRLAKIDINSYNSVSFTDIKTNSIYGPYVEWANKNNIVSGTGNNQFMPDKAITREEMAAIMMKYARNFDYAVPITNAPVIYEDNENISTWSKDAVGSMQQAGVLKGKNNNYFAPKDSATRAEACVVLHRFVQLDIDQDVTN
jgi:hypothetical protein